MSWLARFGLAASALSVLCLPANVHAYCRQTTCTPADEECVFDAQGCKVSGAPLAWASGCVTYAVGRTGSIKNRISAYELEAAVEHAFATWLNVDCGGGQRPSLEVQSLGAIECERASFAPKGPNANVIFFEDEEFTASGDDALASTLLRFGRSEGALLDADVIINGVSGNVTNRRTRDGIDLQSIVLHEVGHFLGLAHSDVAGATMYPYYQPSFDDLRQLTRDDAAGICAIYPPGRLIESAECTPRGGFSSACAERETAGPGPSEASCAIGRLPATTSSTLLAVMVLGLWRQRARAQPMASAGAKRR